MPENALKPGRHHVVAGVARRRLTGLGASRSARADGDPSAGRTLHEAGASGHVLQTTALVNEAYMRLIDWKGVSWQNRAHFLGVAAQLMRHILVDFARKRPVAEGEQEAVHVSLDEARLLAPEKSAEVIAVDDALKALATFDPRKSQIVELRYFGGLSVEETAEVLGLAPITVMREWNKAKAWLYRELSKSVTSDKSVASGE